MVNGAAIATTVKMERNQIANRLRSRGLRPTWQRIALAEVLFGDGHRHVTSEDIHSEAVARGITLSLATVYNTLNQFTAVGLLRVLSVGGPRCWFDTDISSCNHLIIEQTQTIVDINERLEVKNLPAPPPGFEVRDVEVMVRLRPKDG